jgi:transposase
MPNPSLSAPLRFIGLDIHKEYFVAVGVAPDRQVVFGPQRVPVYGVDAWIEKHLSRSDAVVLEVTVNSWLFHDALLPFVHSVTVVHPPNVALVTQVRVKTDKKAAQSLAELLSAGLLQGVWVPPLEVRHLRALIAQRAKMVDLATMAKNRLSSVLHRNHLLYTGGSNRFHPQAREWWQALPLSAMELFIISSDLDTLEFAKLQIERIEQQLQQAAAKDNRVPLLTQLPGVAMLSAITILAAIGTISRFPNAKQLVGYAGLGTSVHDSGMVHHNGRITKAGRKDLRGAMVDAANAAVRHHPFWKHEFSRMERHLGRSKAIVAIARKLLVAVWHILTRETADVHADEKSVAASLFKLAYEMRVKNLPEGKSAKEFTRAQLDRLGLGASISSISWGSKRVKLPPSKL